MAKKILFATDLGAFTHHGLAHVEELAQSFGAQVSIVHAVNPMGELATAVVKSYCSDFAEKEILHPNLIKSVLDSVRNQIFELLLSESPFNTDFVSRIADISVFEGQPATVILQEAERVNADMIVIGHHGSHAINNNILGSVAAKVLQLAKVPVYMVPMMDAGSLYLTNKERQHSDYPANQRLNS